MKARIKKTGEILTIAEHSQITMENCDSYGNPLEYAPEEIELIDETNLKSDIDWEQRRYEIAKAAMQGLLNATSVERFTLRIKPSTIAEAAIEYTDALITELKKM